MKSSLLFNRYALAFALSAALAAPALAQQDLSSRPADISNPDNSAKPNPANPDYNRNNTAGTAPVREVQGGTYAGDVTPMERTPVYRVNVVSREVNAVNYRHHSGQTKVDMRGTELAPKIHGDATVDSKTGRIVIRTDMHDFEPATHFGPEYLTYVLWAVTPEGRAQNIGEIIPHDDGHAEQEVTTDLQAFGLIVTAEPYFAVTRPSDMIVAQNVIRPNTKGWEVPINARFEALNRGAYTVDISPAQLPATGADVKKTDINLLEARNAVAIAKAEGAEHYAPDALARAQDFLARAEDYERRHQGHKAIGTVARGAVQNAEDARLLSIRKREEERVAHERELQQQRTEEARMRADEASDRARQAESERLAADQARAQAEQAAQQAARERAAADAAKQAAIEQQQQLAAQAQQAQLSAQQARDQAERAERDREQMRAQLLQQLNTVLQTRDTARGLIVNMSDVLFDFNKATLKPGARERLAKVAGIILTHPDLRLQIEGYTDSIGSDSYNLELSRRRAETVRDYLVSQGVPAANVAATGFGKDNPVASNDTAAGRQMNRRVDLVVSGESIQSARSQQLPANGVSAGAAAGTTAGTVGAGVGAGTNSATVPVSPNAVGSSTLPPGNTTVAPTTVLTPNTNSDSQNPPSSNPRPPDTNQTEPTTTPR